MSELKAFEVTGKALFGRFYTKKVYDKDEADKVIAHHKYKRCLNKAKLCHWKAGIFIYKKEKSDFYYRWYKRWLKIAEQFNEAK